jgi:hypothetical protein
VNAELIRRTVSGEVVAPEELELLRAETEVQLRKLGSKRRITEIKKYLDDVPKSVTIHTTDEARNKAVYFESLSNAIALLAPEDPRRNALIDKILEAIGISKEELEAYGTAPYLSAQNPQLSAEQLGKAGMVGADLALK